MANRRAMKLLAAALVASAAPAGADTTTQAAQARVPTASEVDWNGRIDIFRIKPRELRSGRPAPGNSEGKQPGPPTPTREQQMLFAASLEYQAANTPLPPIKPRVYASFRPACGNTGGKVDAPKDCTAAEVTAAAAYDKEWSRLREIQEAKAAPRRQAAYQKLMAATAAAMRADPTLKARLFEGGRPACGNTMSKKGPASYCRLDEGIAQ